MDRIKKNIEQTTKKLEVFKENGMRDPGEEKFERVINRVLPYINRNSSILDVGCRGGFFFDALKNYGFKNFYGTDILLEGIDILHDKGYKGEISDIQMDSLNKSFDIIFLVHVLEHTSNPSKAINNVYKMLNGNGIFYVEVPRRTPEKDKDPSHFIQFPDFDTLNSYFSKNKWKLLWYQDDFPVIGIYKRK